MEAQHKNRIISKKEHQTGESIKVLHVDDDTCILDYVEEFVKQAETNIFFTNVDSPEAAIELLKNQEFDCIISDYRMPNIDGVELSKHIKKICNTPIILYTGQGSEEVAEKAYAAGISDYIRKENHPAHYQVLAKRIVSVVEKKRVENRTHQLEKQMRGKLEALLNHAIKLSTCNNKSSITNLTIEIVCKVMGYDFVSVGFVEGEKIRFVGTRGENGGWPTELGINGPGITAKAVRLGSTQLVPDIRLNPDYVGPKDEISIYNERLSELVIPIKIGNKVVAVINIEDERVAAFTEEDVRILEILSEHISSAIQRIRLLDAEKQYTANLEVLQRHAYTLPSLNSIDEVAEYSFQIIKNLLGITDGAFGVVEDNRIRFCYAPNAQTADLPILTLNGKGIAARAARTGLTQYVPDVRIDQDYVVGTIGTLTELDVPVKMGNKVIAVINLEDTKPDAFSNEDRKIIEILCENISSAIVRINNIKQLKDSEKRYRTILDASYDGEVLLSGTTIIYANKSEADMLGYDDPEELIGKDVSIFLVEEDKERIKTRTLRRQSGISEPNRYEIRLRRKDEKIIYVETATTLLEYDGKNVVLAVTRDITDIKKYERQLTALHNHAYKLTEATDIDEVCELTLKTIESVIGFQMGSFLIVDGKNLVSISRLGSLSSMGPIPITGKGITARAAREMKSQLILDVRVDPDFLKGETDTLSELAVPVILDGKTVAVLNFESLELNGFDEVGKKLVETLALHVSQTLHRLFEVKELKEQEEKRRKEVMEGANKLISMVRHDLRSPLQTIQNASYLMNHRVSGVEEYARKIDAGVEYAVRILDDLKIMAGPHNIKCERVDLNNLVKASLDTTVFNPTIRVETKYNEPLFVNADIYMIRRVVDNLLKNAIEAMDRGGTLRLEIGTSGLNAFIKVKDTGKGISKESASKLFTPFYTTKSTGTGLGLVICKQVVEAHGGELIFDSVEGVGTTFTVSIPAADKPVIEAPLFQG